MDAQETKESLTPLQAMQVKIEKLEISFDWLKWIVGTGLLGLAGLMTYLHSDTKQSIQKLETSTSQDKLELKQDIQEIRTLLIQLIQNTSRLPRLPKAGKQAGQDTSKAKKQAKR